MKKENTMTTVKLATPIMHGQEEITELNFRMPVAKDLRKYEMTYLNKFSKIQSLSAQLCGLPESVLDNLKMEDLINCSRMILSFLPPSLETPESV